MLPQLYVKQGSWCFRLVSKEYDDFSKLVMAETSHFAISTSLLCMSLLFPYVVQHEVKICSAALEQLILLSTLLRFFHSYFRRWKFQLELSKVVITQYLIRVRHAPTSSWYGGSYSIAYLAIPRTCSGKSIDKSVRYLSHLVPIHQPRSGRSLDWPGRKSSNHRWIREGGPAPSLTALTHAWR